MLIDRRNLHRYGPAHLQRGGFLKKLIRKGKNALNPKGLVGTLGKELLGVIKPIATGKIEQLADSAKSTAKGKVRELLGVGGANVRSTVKSGSGMRMIGSGKKKPAKSKPSAKATKKPTPKSRAQFDSFLGASMKKKQSGKGLRMM